MRVRSRTRNRCPRNLRRPRPRDRTSGETLWDQTCGLLRRSGVWLRRFGSAGVRSADWIDPFDEDVEPRELQRRDLPFAVDPAVGLPVVPGPAQAVAVGGPDEHVLHRPDAGRL